MIDFSQYLPQRMFLVQGPTDAFETTVHSLEQQFQIVHGMSVARFTVDHAKSVASFVLEGDGMERCMVVSFAVFSPDAAQVLLKALEEPDLSTTLVLITPYPYVVPQTIRSRVVLIHSYDRVQSSEKHLTTLDLLELAKKDDDSVDAATKRAQTVQLLDSIEQQVKKDSRKARALYEAKHMLLQANLPTKYVLEYVATMIQ